MPSEVLGECRKMTISFDKVVPILRIFDVPKAFYVDFLGFAVNWEHQARDRDDILRRPLCPGHRPVRQLHPVQRGPEGRESDLRRSATR